MNIGRRSPAFPAYTTRRTGPYRAVRRVELSAASQSRNPERVEVSIGQRKIKSRSQFLSFRRRRERIRFGLPDALDLLVVCVESGLGLDQAIRMVGDELTITHPDLSKELSIVSLEMRAGATRTAALRNVAQRTSEEELRKLVAVLIQTDRFGTSLAGSLRTHAKFLRVRRRHEAEERAGKIGVKLTFPIFFFMLPSIVVVAVGPAALRVFKEVLPALHNTGLGH